MWNNNQDSTTQPFADDQNQDQNENVTAEDEQDLDEHQTNQTSNQGGTQDQEKRGEFENSTNLGHVDHKGEERERSLNWDKEGQQPHQGGPEQKQGGKDLDFNEQDEMQRQNRREEEANKFPSDENNLNRTDENYLKDRMRDEGGNFTVDPDHNRHSAGNNSGPK